MNKIHVFPNMILLFALLFPAYVANAEEIDLFVLAGQSNAQGWVGDAMYYPTDPHGIDNKIRFYWSAPGFSSSGGKWTTLKAQKGIFWKGHFGPEVSFARSLKTAGYNVALFKYSRGGTSLAHHWKGPGDGAMYDQMKNELNKAIQLLRKERHQVRLRGLVWIQGESDAETPQMAQAYQGRLRVLIDDFRRSVARNPRLPVVLGVDEQHHLVKRNPEVLWAQQALAQADRHTAFSSMMHLPKADGTHLTPRGLEGHGRRIFEVYRRIPGS